MHFEPVPVDRRDLPAAPALGECKPGENGGDAAARRGKRLWVQALRDMAQSGFGRIALVDWPLRSLITPAPIASSAAHVTAASIGAPPAAAATLSAGKVRMMSKTVSMPTAVRAGGGLPS
jgi:hypothetical protein